MGGETKLSGPDLASGVAEDTVPATGSLLGQANGEAVVLVRQGEEIFALGATCSHYGGPLAEGLVVDGTIRCPWHHARFDLATGAPLGGPGLGALPCFEVERVDKLVKVGKKRGAAPKKTSPRSPASVVVVGSGASALLVADTLRAE